MTRKTGQQNRGDKIQNWTLVHTGRQHDENSISNECGEDGLFNKGFSGNLTDTCKKIDLFLTHVLYKINSKKSKT